MKQVVIWSIFFFAVNLGAQETNPPKRTTPIEWGTAYKREWVFIQDFKKPGIFNAEILVEVLSIKNLVSGQYFYYPRFSGYDLEYKKTKIVSITPIQLEEAIIFCKSLSEYVSEPNPKNYTEYKYETQDGTFEFGVYWNTDTSKWRFYISIDPRFETEITHTYDTTYISQLYKTLLNCKGMIERLKTSEK